MLPLILFLLISCANAQYNTYFPAQYPSGYYNPWSSYLPNNPMWNQGIQSNRASVRGNLLSGDIYPLPYGSRITVSIADVSLQDAPARPLNTISLYGSYRFPIAYEIPYSLAQVQANNNPQQYAIQARIEKDGQLLYINDQYTPVRLIPVPLYPVNVAMKKISSPIYPGNDGGFYTTGSPIISGIYACQLKPEIGLCHASIPQYYFNTQTRSCQMFLWGGCGGNQNRFQTQEECERRCSLYRRKNNAKQKWSG